MRFSVIFNSRGRPAMLYECLSKLRDTHSGKTELEVIVNFDDDDYESLKHLDYFEQEFEFLRTKISPRFINCHYEINKMAFEAKGDVILPWGDDCHMLTENWDVIAEFEFGLQKIFGPLDNIWMAGIDSTSVDKDITTAVGWYPDIFFITKEGRDANGWLVHDHFVSLGADVATYSVYKGVNRYIDLRAIKYDHTTHNTIEKVINPDNTAAQYRARQAQFQKLDPFTHDYSKDIEKLKKVINEKR